MNLLKTNALLYYGGWAFLVLAVLFLLLMAIDHRQITGINAWVKPLKFALSIWIFLWTMTWITPFDASGLTQQVSWIMLATMVVEIVLIILQAVRGQRSHFNITSPDGTLIYAIMGIAIAINTVVVGVIAARFWFNPADANALIIWGIRFGLVSLLLGSVLGGYMAQHMSHNIGGPDDGPGLPLLNWSTRYGDLRVAHFIGLHGVQLLLLLAVLLPRLVAAESAFWLLTGTFVLHTAFTVGTFVQALRGLPLWRM